MTGRSARGTTAARAFAPDTAGPPGAAARTRLEAPPGRPRHPAKPFGTWGWLRWAWRQLTSMRTALVLLFLLALASVPGSVLPQQGINPAGVQQYYQAHPAVASALNALGLFNVFASPWFAAIYLLLFTSLAGCVLPRTYRLAVSAGAPPPRAPRYPARLPLGSRHETPLPPAEALAAAAVLLRRKRFRLSTGDGWVSAEKGYRREVGNLLFHVALLALLAAVGLGGMFGYKADKLLVEGDSFANTVSSLDEFHPGRLVTPAGLQPFTIRLDRFRARYVSSGRLAGQPASFAASVRYAARPGGPLRRYDLRVNHPLVVGVFLPTAVDANGRLASAFPAPLLPRVSLVAYAGDLGMNAGAPQSVYALDTTHMRRLPIVPRPLAPGQRMRLPDGAGTLTFTGYRQWTSLAITYDPGQLPALASGIAALVGLLLSFLVRRRRVFVRAYAAGDGPTVVEAGGLARADAGGGFDEEFAGLAAELRSAHQGGPPANRGGGSAVTHNDHGRSVHAEGE